ncbi:MAG: phosphoribosylanthranilate isomerase [Acidobacteriota bacterium]
MSPRRPWIKVCGIRTERELEFCALAGATHAGLNGWERSPRFLPPESMARLQGAARSLGLVPVLVLSPLNAASLASLAGFAPGWLQLTAAPAPSLRRELARTGWRLLEARRALPGSLPAPTWGHLLLLDAPGPAAGGNGRRFDWSLAASAPRPFLLAGGLGPDNVESAVAACSPAGVDAATGLESSPGVKDPGRVRAFCAAARRALAAAAPGFSVPTIPLRSDPCPSI